VIAPRKTRIICTIGPATASYEALERLYEAGMNVVRINMSHSDHASAGRIIAWIKTLNRKVRYPVPIMLDTQGPEIRTGDLSVALNLKTNDVIDLTVRDGVDVERQSIHVNYADLVNAVAVGDPISVDNGLINLLVLAKSGSHLTCRVLDGGVLKGKRHVNLPGVRVNLPAITDKDRLDIAFAIANELDFIALSFVRRADDVHELRTLLGNKADKMKIIAKIEDAEGVENVESIAAAADAVMVARGDLGIEINLAELPNVQRQIVRVCAEHGRRVIVATHLLESMIQNPVPTRAEVTDVANAVYEEVDAVMLSGETSVGQHPVRCVEQLDQIAHRHRVEGASGGDGVEGLLRLRQGLRVRRVQRRGRSVWPLPRTPPRVERHDVTKADVRDALRGQAHGERLARWAESQPIEEFGREAEFLAFDARRDVHAVDAQ